MIDFAHGVKMDVWKNKQNFLHYYHNVKKQHIQDEKGFLNVWNFCSMRNDERLSVNILKELPYLIFTDITILYDKWYILKAISYDPNMFTTMLEIGDERLKKIIYNERIIKTAVINYHSNIEFTFFENDKTFANLLHKDETFLYAYFKVKYHELLYTEEGQRFYNLYYKGSSNDFFYKMVEYLAEVMDTDSIEKLYKLSEKKNEYYETDEFAYPPNPPYLSVEEFLRIAEEYDYIEYERYGERVEYNRNNSNQAVDVLVSLLENKDYNKVHYILSKVDDLIIRFGIDKGNKFINMYHPNFRFYIDCAKKGIPMLMYSENFNSNYWMWIILLSYNAKLISYVPKSLLYDTDFVLDARYFCEDVLLYCHPCLFKNRSFILEYISRFEVKGYFKLDKTLQQDKVFIEKAKGIDENIIFYVESE